MDAASFTQMLRRLTPADFRLIGAALHVSTASAADEVEAWRLTITVDRALRRAQRSRAAAHAASAASHAVLACAATHSIELPDANVTTVARAAAEVARALVAGEDARSEADALLMPFASLVSAGVAA